MKIFCHTFLLFIFSIFCSVAQDSLEITEYQIDIDNRFGEDFRVIPLGQKGILVFIESNKVLDNGAREMRVFHLDTALRLVWQKEFMLLQSFSMSFYTESQGDVYFLFSNSLPEHKLGRLDVKNASLTFYDITDIRNFFVEKMEVLKGAVFLLGSVERKKTAFRFDLGAGTKQVLASLNQLEGAGFREIAKDTVFNVLNVVTERYDKGHWKQTLYRYDAEGKQLSSVQLPYSQEFTLHTVRVAYKNLSEFCLVGTYGLGQAIYTQGVYSMLVRNGNVVDSRFYDFRYFKNFFQHMSKKDRDRLLSKIEERIDKERMYKFDYSIVLSDLQYMPNGFSLYGESYRPYLQNTYYDYTNYSRKSQFGTSRLPNSSIPIRRAFSFYPMTYRIDENVLGNTVFPDEYRFTHGFSMYFDLETGKLKADNAMKLEKSFDRQLYVSAGFLALSDTSALAIRPYEDKIHYKLFAKSKWEENNRELPWKLADNQRNAFLQNGGTLTWTRNTLLFVGIRKVSNTDENQGRHLLLMKIAYAKN